ncbi:MAG: hypothetical protein ABUS79_30460 [Pseudomonadota bacterium]
MSRLATFWMIARSMAVATITFVGRVLLVFAAIIPVALARRRARRRHARLAPLPRRSRPRVLFIGGTINHTTQVRQIAAELPDCDHAFTWYYGDGVLEVLRRLRRLESTAMGYKLRARCLAHLKEHGAPLDLGGARGAYDLAVTCSDLVVPQNIRGRPMVLVQEGMTDPEDLVFRLVRRYRLPPWITADSSATGLSHAYDRFCVASDGYRALFERKGVPAEKIVVTGIPNFDNCDRFLKNDFPHRGYVLVCSSDIRETLRWENRPRFIREVLAIAAGRQIVWKLHPNEKVKRARRELAELAPGALVFESGNAEEMIANCDVLVTQFSSTAYVGLALGKEVHSYFDVDELRRLCPVQNGRTSARRIANVCRDLLGLPARPDILGDSELGVPAGDRLVV